MSSLRQLASTLGLSITTVSRALDGYPDVSAATRQRVIDAARKTNYRPHAAARRLRLGSTETVTMVIPGTPGHFDEPLYLELLTALGAREEGHARQHQDRRQPQPAVLRPISGSTLMKGLGMVAPLVGAVIGAVMLIWPDRRTSDPRRMALGCSFMKCGAP